MIENLGHQEVDVLGISWGGGLAQQFALFFFFNDTATTEIYTLSLHDALPIFCPPPVVLQAQHPQHRRVLGQHLARQHVEPVAQPDRKSTRLNSSHVSISY